MKESENPLNAQNGTVEKILVAKTERSHTMSTCKYVEHLTDMVGFAEGY